MSGTEEQAAQRPITKSTLKTAEPTMVPKPTSLLATKTPIKLVKNSGALPPAAINVAPYRNEHESHIFRHLGNGEDSQRRLLVYPTQRTCKLAPHRNKHHIQYSTPTSCIQYLKRHMSYIHAYGNKLATKRVRV